MSPNHQSKIINRQSKMFCPNARDASPEERGDGGHGFHYRDQGFPASPARFALAPARRARRASLPSVPTKAKRRLVG